MELSFPSASEWAALHQSLPAALAEPCYHPAWSEAARQWERALPGPACAIARPSAGQTFLYPFLRHALPFPLSSAHAVPDSPEATEVHLATRPTAAHAATHPVAPQPTNRPAHFTPHDIQSPYGYGGPLFVGDWSADEKIDALQSLARFLREQGAVAEFIRCHTEWCDTDTLAAAGYKVFQVRTNVECDLSKSDFTADWAPSARRNLRKAQSAGLYWRQARNPADIDHFHRLYLSTADRLSMAPHYRFDRAYIDALLTIPGLHLLLVEAPAPPATTDPAESRYDPSDPTDPTDPANAPIPVAAAVLLLGGEIAFYHLGASDFAFQQIRPNDYLYFAMASLARQRGCKKIVWGGGMSNDPEDSLFRFKTHFGALCRPAFCAGRILDESAFENQCAGWKKANPDRESKLFLKYRA